jgi:N-acetylglucosaminyl-diphospho-decaprenol L-rhamnosyltransferase
MSASCDIVIVNWNAGGQLRECIDSLAAQPGSAADLRVVIVDNGSTDGSLEGLDRAGAPLTILRNGENRGFAAACNQGAAVGSADYLLFLNPDTILGSDSLALPLAFLERPENASVGACGIQLVDETGTIARSCARLPRPRHFAAKMLGLDRLAPRRFPSHNMQEWDHAESRDVDHVIGAFYLIRRALFEQLGGFDERFFVYLEDLDLSARVHQAGFRIRYIADARAFHKGGGASEQVKARRLCYALQSRNAYGFKHFSRPAAVLLMAGTMLVEPFARLALALAQRSPATVKETLGGYGALWSAWPPWRPRTRAAQR